MTESVAVRVAKRQAERGFVEGARYAIQRVVALREQTANSENGPDILARNLDRLVRTNGRLAEGLKAPTYCVKDSGAADRKKRAVDEAHTDLLQKRKTFLAQIEHLQEALLRVSSKRAAKKISSRIRALRLEMEAI